MSARISQNDSQSVTAKVTRKSVNVGLDLRKSTSVRVFVWRGVYRWIFVEHLLEFIRKRAERFTVSDTFHLLCDTKRGGI